MHVDAQWQGGVKLGGHSCQQQEVNSFIKFSWTVGSLPVGKKKIHFLLITITFNFLQFLSNFWFIQHKKLFYILGQNRFGIMDPQKNPKSFLLINSLNGFVINLKIQ